MKTEQIEQKLGPIEFELEQLQSTVEKKIEQLKEIEKRLWQLENIPKYKYGDTFGKIKVLECRAENTFYFLLDSRYMYYYTIDNGSSVEINISEENLTKMIEKK